MNDACTTVSLPTEMLINNISRSLFATANDELRPVMNGIYFDLTADALAIVALSLIHISKQSTQAGGFEQDRFHRLECGKEC